MTNEEREELLDEVFEYSASLGRKVQEAFVFEYQRGRRDLAEYLSNFAENMRRS